MAYTSFMAEKLFISLRKNGGLDDIFHRKSRLRQNSLNIGRGLMGLLCDTPRSEATSRGVYGQLPGCDDQITGTDSL